MKKKIVAAALAVLLCLSGCGSEGLSDEFREQYAKEQQEKNKDKEKNKEKEIIPSEKPEVTEPPANPAPVHKNSIVHLLKTLIYKSEYTTSGSYTEVKYNTYSLSEADAATYPELAAALELLSESKNNRMPDILQSLTQTSNEMGEFLGDRPLCSDEDSYVLRADNQVVSLLSYVYEDWGGAHPSDNYFTMNYDSANGKSLFLGDVVKDTERFFQLVDQKLMTEYADCYEEMIPLSAYLEGIDFKTSDVEWTIDNEGVTIYFNAYGLGSYALGSQVITIYFEEAPEVFEQRYMPNAEQYIIPVEGYTALRLDVNGDGKRELIEIEQVSADEYFLSWIVHVGNRSCRVDNWSYGKESYVVCKNGKYYLYLFETTDNDYVILSVINLATMQLVEESYSGLQLSDLDHNWYSGLNLYGYSTVSEAFTDPDGFMMDKHMDFVGTYPGMMKYCVADNGALKKLGDFYEVTPHIVKTLQNIPCKETNAKGEVIGDIVLPAGTIVYYVRTDSETYLDVQIADESNIITSGSEDYVWYEAIETPTLNTKEKIYRIPVKRVNWQGTIDGKPEEEVLEGIVYAG